MSRGHRRVSNLTSHALASTFMRFGSGLFQGEDTEYVHDEQETT